MYDLVGQPLGFDQAWDLVPLPNGGYLGTRNDWGADTATAQFFDAGAEPVGPSHTIQMDRYSQYLPIDTLVWSTPGDGRITAAWVSDFGEGQTTVSFRSFGFDGSAIGAPASFAVQNDYWRGRVPEVVARPDGSIVVGWTDQVSDGGAARTASYVRIIDADGQPLSDATEMPLARGHEYFVSKFEAMSDGGFVAVVEHSWSDHFNHVSGVDHIAVLRYGADGTPIGGPVAIAATVAYNESVVTDVAELSNGGFVVAWGESRAGGTDMQVFAADGSPVGGVISVQREFFPGWPEVTAGPDGSFLVSWFDYGSDGSYQVFAQRFADDGGKIGEPFSLESGLEGDYALTALELLGDGRLLATWAGDPDGEGPQTRHTVVRRYEPDNAPPSGENDALTAFEGVWTANLAPQLLANDGDFDGDGLRIVGIDTSGTAGRVLFDEASQTLRYLATGRMQSWEIAEDSFTYTLSDGVATTTATVTVDMVGATAGRRWKHAGSDESDVIVGRGGADRVIGRGGDDLVVFSAGNDGIDGGGDADVLMLRRGFDVDRVWGFTHTQDLIDARAMFGAKGHGGAFRRLDSNGDGVLDGRDQGIFTAKNWMTVRFGGGDVLKLHGVTQLTAGDFGNHLLPEAAPDVPPSLADDRISVFEGQYSGNIARKLLANDGFGLGDDLRITGVDTTGTAGRVIFNEARQVLVYVGDADGPQDSWHKAADSFTYTVSDGTTTRTATVHVGVTGAVDAKDWWKFLGTNGSDVITGRVEPDLALGFGGHDLIVFSAGNDRVNGGPGRDVLLLHDGFDVDRVWGFGKGDRIDAREVLDVASHAAVFRALDSNRDGVLNAADDAVTKNGWWFEIDFGGGDVLRLGGVRALDRGDFGNHLLPDAPQESWFTTAWTRACGREMLKIDADGTLTVIDVSEGAASSNCRNFVQVGDEVYFQAMRPETGLELYKTDLDGNVSLVADVNPGSGWSRIQNIQEFAGDLYFVGYPEPFDTVSHLYRVQADGTLEIFAEGGGSYARFGNALYVTSGQGADRQFFRMEPDGTRTDIDLQGGSASISDAAVLGGRLYFTGLHGTADSVRDLMRLEADGSVTVLAALQEHVLDLTALGDTLYGRHWDSAAGEYRLVRFTADWSLEVVDGVDARRLEVLDDHIVVADGDALVVVEADGSVRSQAFDRFVGEAAELGDRVYFSAFGSGGDLDLYMIDQDGSVQQIADIMPDASRPSIGEFTVSGDAVYFLASDAWTDDVPTLYALREKGKGVVVGPVGDHGGDYVFA